MVPFNCDSFYLFACSLMVCFDCNLRTFCSFVCLLARLCHGSLQSITIRIRLLAPSPCSLIFLLGPWFPLIVIHILIICLLQVLTVWSFRRVLWFTSIAHSQFIRLRIHVLCTWFQYKSGASIEFKVHFSLASLIVVSALADLKWLAAKSPSCWSFHHARGALRSWSRFCRSPTCAPCCVVCHWVAANCAVFFCTTTTCSGFVGCACMCSARTTS